MMWTQDISIGELHYIRSKFAEQQGARGIEIKSFNRATEVFYNTKQYAVNGDKFIVWGYLTKEREDNFLDGKLDWLENVTEGELWVFEANIKAIKTRILKNMVKHKQLKFLIANGVRTIKLRRDNLCLQ